jgi:hypothetical protein
VFSSARFAVERENSQLLRSWPNHSQSWIPPGALIASLLGFDGKKLESEIKRNKTREGEGICFEMSPL